MQRNRWITRLAFLVLTLFVAGCASSRSASGGPGGSSNSAILRVTSVPAAGSLSIYVVSSVGGRRLVGYARTGQESEFRFDFPGNGTYQFVAETLSRASVVSNAVYLRPGTVVEWDLNSSIALVSE